MRSILPKRTSRSSLESHPLSQTPNRTSPSDAAPIICIRDRGLDHAVEREKFLIPVVNLKNLLKSEPSKSLPISVIADSRDALHIPIRPIDFVRRYPSIFAEFLPGNIGVHPHFKLTDEVLELDAEEMLVYHRESYRQEAADRVLKLLMISKVLKMPLDIIDRLKWDMGLPQDFVQSIVPEFPDCFRVVDVEGTRVLELVCWSGDLAKSVMEKRAVNHTKGMPINFTMHFSNGFQMDKKLKKWIDEWQKLPYISPYENGLHLSQSSDESDKWAVGVLHELLNLFVSKKIERDDMFSVGEYLGVRSRFKRAMLDHPGIFYVSSKNRTHTVILKEAFKRGSLIEQHPLMDMRNRYIHLMNMVKEEKKVIATSGSKQMKNVSDVSEQQREVEDENGDEVDDEDDDNFEDDEEDDNDKRTRTRVHKNASQRGNGTRKSNLHPRYNSRSPAGVEDDDDFEDDEENDNVRQTRTRAHKYASPRGNGTRRSNSHPRYDSKSHARAEDDGEDDDFEDDEENGNVRRTWTQAHKNASPRGNGTRKSNSHLRYNSRSHARVEDDGEDDDFEDDEENNNVRPTRTRADKNASPRGHETRKSNSFPRYNSRSCAGDKSAGESHGKKTKRVLAKLSTRDV